MTGQAMLWSGAGASLVLAIVAAVADRRRNARRNLDAPGWMPWSFLQVAGLLGVLVCAALAVKTG